MVFIKLKSRAGYRHSEKTKQKMRKASIRINNYKHLIANMHKIRKKIKDNKGNIFESLTSASKFHNISSQTVCDILKLRHSKTRKGIIFYYV